MPGFKNGKDLIRGSDYDDLKDISDEIAGVETKVDTVDTVVDGIQTDLDNATDGLGALKTLIDGVETKVDTVDTVVDGIQTDLDNATDGLGALKTLIDGVETKVDTVDTVVDGIQTDLDNATDGLGALKTLIDGVETKVDTAIADIGTVDTVVDGIQTDLSNATDGLGALKALIDALQTDVTAILAAVGTSSVGHFQFTATTEDLAGGAATNDLFTGTAQHVILETLVVRLPDVDMSDDVAAYTGFSIQTDDSTPQVFVDITDGAKANCTAEAQMAWAGLSMIDVGAKIQITIAGGVGDAATVADIIVGYRSVVAGGSLAAS